MPHRSARALAWKNLPFFGLAFLGGTLGGSVGGGAMLLETHIAASEGAPWIRVIAILSVAFAAVMVLLGGLWWIHRTLMGMAGKGRL